MQKIVAFFKLIPKEQVVLTEFERRIQVVLVDRVGPKHIQKTEQPAATARLLVGDLGVDVQLIGERRVEGVGPGWIDECFGQVGVGDGIPRNVLHRVRLRIEVGAKCF